MYYAETIIDGVLHWKNHPNTEWTPYTVEELSEMLKESREKVTELSESLDKVTTNINNLLK